MSAPTFPVLAHECNAYCRGARHACVAVASGARDLPTVAAMARDLCDRVGVRFVHIEAAPEATIAEGEPTDFHRPDGSISRQQVYANDVPFLLIYDETEATR